MKLVFSASQLSTPTSGGSSSSELKSGMTKSSTKTGKILKYCIK
jgi:hypothetical protein